MDFFNKYKKYKQLYVNSKYENVRGGTLSKSPYYDEKTNKWIPPDFKAIQSGIYIEIPDQVVAVPLQDNDWQIKEYNNPIVYKVGEPIGEPGAQGSAFVVYNNQHTYVLKQIFPAKYNVDKEYEGSCVTDSVSFSGYTNSRKVVSDEIIEPYFQARDEYESGQLLPRKVCDDLFIQELAYSVLFGHLGVSPIVRGYRLDNYCIVMDILDKTLGDCWEQQNKQLTKNQWQQLLNIQKTINDQHIIHNDSKPNNYMLDNKGKIYIIDWGLAKKNDRWNPNYLENRFPSAVFQLGDLLPLQLSRRRNLTWGDIADFFELDT
jgi:serine/threonine protein kinase